MIEKKCTVPGCDRDAKYKGHCPSHYQQFVRIRRDYPDESLEEQLRRLTPLRGPHGRLGEERLISFGISVSPACTDALEALGGRSTAARCILELEAPRRAADLGTATRSDAVECAGKANKNKDKKKKSKTA